MEHVARTEGRIGDSIYLMVHADVLQWDGVLFAPDVANKKGVEAYPIQQAAKMIDFEVLYSRTDWRNEAIQGRLQRAEKCEVLVPRSIPLEMLRNLPHG